jgi:hypothetical protein
MLYSNRRRQAYNKSIVVVQVLVVIPVEKSTVSTSRVVETCGHNGICNVMHIVFIYIALIKGHDVLHVVITVFTSHVYTSVKKPVRGISKWVAILYVVLCLKDGCTKCDGGRVNISTTGRGK